MTPTQVRKVLGVPYTSFRKGPYAQYPTDAFDSLGIHVYYKQVGTCEAVEFSRAGTVIWQAESLLEKTPANLFSLLAHEDPEIDENPDGFASHKLGIAAYVPGYKKDPRKARVEGILVFEEGYYANQ